MVLQTRSRLRVLGPADLDDVHRLIAQDPITNVFVDHRVRITNLEPRWVGGEVWGYDEGGELLSICHAGANLTPVQATPAALEAFAARALEQGRRCGSIMGPDSDVSALWQVLEPRWGPARSIRPRQPFLVLTGSPHVEPSRLVRRVRPHEIDLLYPACVAMYTEELGVSPELQSGAALYRARVAQLIAKGYAFACIESDEVVFKAELHAVTPAACQIQSVWVNPRHRGRGLAASGVAAVCATAMHDYAPTVSLYVNEHNEPARRAYHRVGFTERCRFATILF
ncbi:MAG: GNAT family N-acetyltransferase [Propionibacteriales bacterium]|nr:GNAT family N-acetyltransferase [Propionibacteriales bacterium]